MNINDLNNNEYQTVGSELKFPSLTLSWIYTIFLIFDPTFGGPVVKKVRNIQNYTLSTDFG